MNRYAGKPLLRLLECYVLWSVGALSQDEEQKLIAMTPKLRELYKLQGAWHEIISNVMEFPDDLPQHLRILWDENVARVINSDIEFSADDLARSIVDDNFVGH